MKGTTSQGTISKGTMPSAPSIDSVPSAKNLHGQTMQGNKDTVKSSSSAGFSASRKCGSLKGNSYPSGA